MALQITTYSEASLKEAIYAVIPSMRETVEGGHYVNIPRLVREALLDFYMERERGFADGGRERLLTAAADVLFTAHGDLEELGMFNYIDMPTEFREKARAIKARHTGMSTKGG